MVVDVREYNYKCTKVIGSVRCFCLCLHCSFDVCACLRGCTCCADALACFLPGRGLGIPVASWVSLASMNAFIVGESA